MIIITPLTNKRYIQSEQEEKLFIELDKGIDDMEKGHMVSHDEAMKQIRERVQSYEL